MNALLIVSRVVTGLYILSLVCLVLAAAAWREMVGVATYAFLIMLAVGVLMSVIEWRYRRSAGNDEP
jgi:heme/copper-type cytochrome/quinol oxidase subunit 2